MSKRRIVYRADGGVSVIVPAPKSRHQYLDTDVMLAGVPGDVRAELDTSAKLTAYFKKHGMDLVWYDELEAEWLERVFTKAMRDDLYGFDYEDVDESEIPKDRTYREAWIGSKGNGISIDAVKKGKVDAGELPKGGLQTQEEIEHNQRIQAKIREIAEREIALEDSGGITR